MITDSGGHVNIDLYSPLYMRIKLTILFLLATALSAAAQSEFHFTDGTSAVFPITRISNIHVRVNTGNDQTLRMPLTFVESIRFKDGCTLFYDKGELQFDKLVQPARLMNESGDVLLEGVLKLTKPQAESLMGPELYGEFRKNNRLLQASLITMAAGTLMMTHYLADSMPCLFNDYSPVDVFKNYSTPLKVVTVSGGVILLSGIVMSIIGNSGCNRVIATYNEGLGLAYTF